MKIKNRLIVKECINDLSPNMEKLSPLFYKALFHMDIELKTIFPGNVVFLNRKFSNMLATLKNVKHLENISDSISKMGQRHILQYGAEIEHFPIMKQALLIALKEFLGKSYNDDLEKAWSSVFDEVAQIMKQAMRSIDCNTQKIAPLTKIIAHDPALLSKIGGEAIVYKVHQNFYDIMFNEPWLETFFLGKSKEALIKKQTQFMVAAFNGPNHYTGDTPAFVHMHLFITDEMADLRERILKSSILAAGLPESIAEKWLSVDHSFRAAIIKKSIDECVLKCQGQIPITAKKPDNYKPDF